MRIVLLLLAAACAPAPTVVDADQDGSPAGEDCDDGNANVRPGGVERCDDLDVDEDCDGRIDGDDPDVADRVYLYADVDGDGHGDPATRTSTCPQAGWTADGTDCDDGDAAVHPGAGETCDVAGADEDCDGRINGADDDQGPPLTWWADADGDGWGAGDAVEACDAPSGHVAVDGDCDDADDAVNPAAAESCDGVDDDCDGEVDEGVTRQVWADADGDGWGGGDPFPGCLGEGTADQGEDCDDGDDGVHPGMRELCGDGVDQDCDPAPADCDLQGERDQFSVDITLAGEVAGDQAGTAVADLGDVNGDGTHDWGLGAPYADAGGSGRGMVLLFGGDLEGDLAIPDASLRVTGSVDFDLLGTAMTGLGDLDGDGVDEFALGGPGLGFGGGVVVFRGPAFVALTTADAAWRGDSEVALDGAGTGLWPTEVDGDGPVELLVSAPEADREGSARGTVWIVDPTATGTDTLQAVALAEVGGTEDDGTLGRAAATPDLDGDGLDDLALGAPGADEGRGRVHLFLGPLAGVTSDGDADTRLDGPASGSAFGAALLSPGDLDGDGADDLVATAPALDGGGYEQGAAWLLVGPTPDLASPRATIEGEDDWENAGSALTAAGDHDGDGTPDLWLVASGWPSGGDAGRVYLVPGALTGTWNLADATTTVDGVEGGSGFGGALAASDIDGDGTRDLLVGAVRGDGEEAASGTASAFLDRGE